MGMLLTVFRHLIMRNNVSHSLFQDILCKDNRVYRLVCVCVCVCVCVLMRLVFERCVKKKKKVTKIRSIKLDRDPE